MRRAFLILALLLCVPAAAQEPRTFAWKVNDANAPPNPAQASKGGFGVMMLVTSDYVGFWEAWEGDTPPKVTATEEVARDRPVHGILLFSGCRPGQDGNCNVTAELSITGPDGSPYSETMSGKVWGGAPAPGYNLQASESSIGFTLDPEDPLGVYTLKAMVRDNVAGTKLAVQQSVTAVDAAAE
jgi:hypothetical protein